MRREKKEYDRSVGTGGGRGWGRQGDDLDGEGGAGGCGDINYFLI